MGAVEASLIIALRRASQEDLSWPFTVAAAFSAVLLAAGVLRHYVDIWKHRTVRGISFLFVGIDAAGDLFSLLSVFFESTLDVLGIVIYATELVLWIGIMCCGAHYNLLPRLTRLSHTVDSDESHQGQSQPHRETSPGIPAAVEPTVIHEDVTIDGVTIHEAPSSTSVFRTPSSDVQTRTVRTRPTALQHSEWSVNWSGVM